MKKFDKGYFYYTLIAALGTSLVLLLCFQELIFDEELWAGGAWLVALGAYAVIYIAQVVWAALYVRCSGYELTDTEIRCRRGVIARKSSVLAYEKVHAVNKRQNIVQRMVGIAVLTVDSGATAGAFGAEISIIERSAEVDRLMALLRARQEGKTVEAAPVESAPQENLYEFSSRMKWAYSALTVGSAVLAVLVLGILALVAMAVAQMLLRSSASLLLWALVGLGAGLVVFGIISLIGGIVGSFVGFHDFQIHKNGSDLQISHGLLVRQTNQVKGHRIRAVKIQEGPVKGLFGYASALLEVVGYGASGGDESGQGQSAGPGWLLPLCKAKELNANLERIVPGYVPDPIAHRAKSYWAFVLWPAFYLGVVFVAVGLGSLVGMALYGAQTATVATVLAILAAALALCLICLLISAGFQYRNAGLTIGQGKLTVQNGGLVRTRTVIRRKSIIAVERRTTPLRAKRGITSYQIHFFSNALTNTVEVRNLDAALAAELEAFLKD